MSEVKWIKLNVDMFDDEKIKIIQAMPDGDALLVVWIKLIALAGKTNDCGYIYISENIPYTEDMLAVIMNKPLLTIRLAMETFTNLGMLENDTKGIYLLNFEKHQSLDKLEAMKEQNRQRQAKFKAKRKMLLNGNVSGNATVTQGNATDIEKEKEKEKDIRDNNIIADGKKHKYGEHKNVLLTDDEFEKLKNKFNDYQERIERLSEGIALKGYKYKSHYLAILNWARNDKGSRIDINRSDTTHVDVYADLKNLEV